MELAARVHGQVAGRLPALCPQVHVTLARRPWAASKPPALLCLPVPGPGFKETAFLYSVSAAALTHTLARACSAGRMERCTCDDSPGLESRQAWQWGVCGDNLKYSTKFLSNFLGPKRGSKDLRARADAHNTNVGIKVSTPCRPGRGVCGRPPRLPPAHTRSRPRMNLIVSTSVPWTSTLGRGREAGKGRGVISAGQQVGASLGPGRGEAGTCLEKGPYSKD